MTSDNKPYNVRYTVFLQYVYVAFLRIWNIYKPNINSILSQIAWIKWMLNPNGLFGVVRNWSPNKPNGISQEHPNIIPHSTAIPKEIVALLIFKLMIVYKM